MQSHTHDLKYLPLVVLCLTLALYGCPKRPEVAEAPATPPGPAAAMLVPTAPPAPVVEARVAAPVTPAAPAGPAEVATPAVNEIVLADVFFDFDRSSIREDQQRAVHTALTALKNDPKLKLVIEGHCDERGTVEYNLALGARRAAAMKDALAAAGIAPERVSIVSYGKERPFASGHEESAWKWNRRDHIVAQNG